MILDFAIIVLLLMTILYSAKLSKNIREMESGKGDVISLVKQLKAVMDITEKELVNIKSVSGEIRDGLNARINDAERLGDDLSFMLKRSEKVMETLDKVIRVDNVMKKKLLAFDDKNVVDNDARFKNYLPQSSKEIKKSSDDGMGSIPKSKERLRLDDIMSIIEGRRV